MSVTPHAERLGPAASSLPLLLAGFGAALVLRVLLGGHDVAGSAPAGLAFAAALLALAWAAGTRVAPTWPLAVRAAVVGLAGALVLCLPVLLSWSPRVVAADGFGRWALVVAVVALAEEVFLRGALYDAVAARWGVDAAIAVGALAFAVLHLPLYGWPAVPLDLAVGVLLGELRRISGTPLAPAVAHTLADWAAWFLR